MTRFLVTGATGRLGGATADHLLRAGVQVRVVVRDPAEKRARALAARGADVVRGSFEDAGSVGRAAHGCLGVFLVTMPTTGPEPGQKGPRKRRGGDPHLEVQQAEAVLAACRAAGVMTAVVSTAAWAGDREKWMDDALVEDEGLRTFLEAKAGVEAAVRAAFCSKHGGREGANGSQVNYTILRPGWANSSYLLPRAPATQTDAGELVHWLEAGRRVPHVDEDDVGRYAAAALLEPAIFGGEELELAGDNVTAGEAASILSRVSGRRVRARHGGSEDDGEEQQQPTAKGFHRWANQVDITTEVAIEYKFGIPLTTLEEYMEKHKEALGRSLPP